MNVAARSLRELSLEEIWLPRILRLGAAGCFIGHGAFGLLTKAAWIPYFGVMGIGAASARQLMPWLGAVDVLIGILVLVWPFRALFLWAALWATWTAFLRPLAGESGWEFFERAGNFGIPIAFLIGAGSLGGWTQRVAGSWPTLTGKTVHELTWTLRLTTAALLAGHAGCGFFLKKALLVAHYRFLGVADPSAVAQYVGALEFALAAAVLIFPLRGLLLAVCIWKIATESLFLASGAPVWEFVERFGSYTSPLALALVLSLAKSRALASSSSFQSTSYHRHA